MYVMDETDRCVFGGRFTAILPDKVGWVTIYATEPNGKEYQIELSPDDIAFLKQELFPIVS